MASPWNMGSPVTIYSLVSLPPHSISLRLSLPTGWLPAEKNKNKEAQRKE